MPVPTPTLHVRGALPPYVVKSLKLDRLGVLNGTAVRHFKVGPINQRIDKRWLLEAPSLWDLPCVDADAEIEPPMCLVTYRYEGSPSGSTADYASREDQIQYELDDSMTEEPIERHPSFAKIAKIYGWDTNTRTFAETLKNDPRGNASNNAAYEAKKTTANPLFGTDSWLAVGIIFRKTWVSSIVPANLLNGIGTIVAAPPGSARFKLPDGAKRRNWLKLAPKVHMRGNVVEITEEWMMSGPNGWIKAIYSAGQLDR